MGIKKSKKGGKDQKSTQLSTTPDPKYHMRKWQKYNLTSQTRAKKSALSQQVTTMQQWTDAKAWQAQDIKNHKWSTQEVPPWNGQ